MHRKLFFFFQFLTFIGKKTEAQGCKFKVNWRRKWLPTPVLLPGESHGKRSLVGYSPWGHKESDRTERLHFTHFILYHWKRKWQSTPVSLPGEPHGQRSLAGHGTWGCRELDMTKVTKHACTKINGFHTTASHLFCSSRLHSENSQGALFWIGLGSVLQ